jgi:pimeloyl-ACP methyl ester carboxylesterase
MKKKNAVLLLHGLGGSIESWINNVNEMSSSQVLRIIALDLPGFGQSDKPKISYTIKFYQQFIAKFLRNLHINKISIVGSSLGGHIAAEVAINSPDIVDKLVLISPAGALPRSFKGTSTLNKYSRIIDAKNVESIKKALFAVDHKPVDDSYARAVFQKISVAGAKEAFLSALKGSAHAPRLNKRLKNIRAPTLLIWGKEDRMIPVRFIDPFVKMKNCRIILLEGCGHRPHADRPRLFNRIVTDFLTTEIIG